MTSQTNPFPERAIFTSGKKRFGNKARNAFLLLLLSLFSTSAMRAQTPAGVVDFIGVPAAVEALEGSLFSVTIRVVPNGQNITVADIGMTFNPEVMQVNSIAFAPGSLMNFANQPAAWNNTTGTLSYGGFNFQPVNTAFNHIVIQFTAQSSGLGFLEHILTGSPKTVAAFAGNAVTGATPSVPVTVLSNNPDCPELGVNDGDPCLVNGQNGAIVNCDCLPFDCDGIPGGSASIDDCGVCAGGTTGTEPCSATCEADAGGIFAINSTTVCNNSNQRVRVNFSQTPNPAYRSFGLITEHTANPRVLAYFQSPPPGGFSFNGYTSPGNTFRIYVLNVENNPLLAQGMNAINNGNKPFLSAVNVLCHDLSDPIIVTRVNCGIVAADIEGIMQVSPNPTEGMAQIQFSTPTSTPATLELHDMSGRLISTLFQEMTDAGQEYRIDYDHAALPNGVYLYRLTTGNEVIIDKVIIAR